MLKYYWFFITLAFLFGLQRINFRKDYEGFNNTDWAVGIEAVLGPVDKGPREA